MPSISRCPRCEQPISIPPGVPGEITVRCPLCNAEYPLADALALLPPMLVPLGLQVLGLAADGSAGGGQAGLETGVETDSQAAQAVAGISGLTDSSLARGEQQAWGTLLADVVETEVVAIDSIVLGEQGLAAGQPLAGSENATAAGIDAIAPAAGIDGSAPAMLPPAPIADEAAGQAAAELWQPEGQPAEEQLGQPTGEGQQAQSAETAEEGFALVGAGGTGGAALPFSIKTRPTRSREVNPLVHIGGVVVFGVVGLGLGYYFSNLLFGPRMDFLHIPLPFVRHTYKHWGWGQGESGDAETRDNGAASEAGAGASGGRNRAKPQQPQGQGQQGVGLPADQPPPSTAQEQAAPPQRKEGTDTAPEKPAATNPPAHAQQPKQPPKKPDQQPGDEPMQLPGDLPDIKSSEPIEEPELDVPPKSGRTPPAK